MKKKTINKGCKEDLVADGPQLCQEDTHYFGHVDVDVNREVRLGAVHVVYVVHLRKRQKDTQCIKTNEINLIKLYTAMVKKTPEEDCTIIPPQRGLWNALEGTSFFL